VDALADRLAPDKEDAPKMHRALIFLAPLVLVVAACSGGEISTTAIPVAVPSPTPSSTSTSAPTGAPSNTPGNTPTATPGSTVVATPGSLSFTTASASAQSVALSEPAYGGTYTEADGCAGIATVVPASNAGGTAVFTVTPAATGSCTVTVTDQIGSTIAVPITVTTSGLIVQGRRN
jgi:hypothetical protein